jgi:hypothetical protein
MSRAHVLILASLLFAPSVLADDCDITQRPAATLLLPYFEVDIHANPWTTTQYTVINTGAAPAIARTTIWTDIGYPLFAFNTFLTGYAAQTIDLHDVLVQSDIGKTSSGSAHGSRSLPNGANNNFAWGEADDCLHPESQMSKVDLAAIRTALTIGRYEAVCDKRRVGLVHANAIGYATIDVVSSCRPSLPSDASYFTQDLLYDNVLTGEYAQIQKGTPFVQAGADQTYASPLVHIRAVPEGGGPANLRSPLGASFYERFTPAGYAKTMDRRQPLPSRFAAPFRQGGSDGAVTSLVIWREGTARGCPTSDDFFLPLDNTAFVRFDEHENPTTERPVCVVTCPPFKPDLPPLSLVNSTSIDFPVQGQDPGGWLFLDLNNPASGLDRRTQSWVVVRRLTPQDARNVDATTLTNGCGR